MRHPLFHLAALSDYIKLPNRGVQFPNPQPAQKNLFLAVLRASKIKVITAAFFIFVSLNLRASPPMGSINDPVLTPNNLAPSGTIQQQINALQADIDERRKILEHQHSSGTHGAYADIIAKETAEIEALKAQLH